MTSTEKCRNSECDFFLKNYDRCVKTTPMLNVGKIIHCTHWVFYKKEKNE